METAAEARHKGVTAFSRCWAKRCSLLEIQGSGLTSYKNIPKTVDRNRSADIVTAAAEIGGIEKRGACRIQTGDKCVCSSHARLHRTAQWEIRGCGPTGDVYAAFRVERYRCRNVC